MKLRIRQATALDTPAMALAKAEAWREAYAGVVPSEILDAQFDEGRLARTAEAWVSMMHEGAHFWVVVDAEAAGEVVGLANAMPAREAEAPTPMELTMIYLRERAKGSGVASALLQTCIGDMDCHLWVLEDNPRARAFYQREGFVADGATRVVWDAHPEVREVRLTRRETAN